MAKPTWTSRAVLRSIEAGCAASCAHCGDQVKFKAKTKGLQVICNVYVNGKWDRVEHFHADCYDLAQAPYGPPDMSQPTRPRASAQNAAPQTASAAAPAA
jgi:hypothetical protein